MHSNILRFVVVLTSLALVMGCQSVVVDQETADADERPNRREGLPKSPIADWTIHDMNRPKPRTITPGQENHQPPSDAIVLFDGSDLSQWVRRGEGGESGEARWKVENGYAQTNRTGGISTKQKFGDCQLHIEWAAPARVVGRSQGRGNSGVYLMSRYEIQILDSYDNISYADGYAAAIYGQYPPLVNAARKPGEWQTYDIIFTAPRFKDGKLIQPAYATVIHNGVVVQNNSKLIGATVWRAVPQYQPHEPTAPIHLQDHDNPVRFRNIWVRQLD